MTQKALLIVEEMVNSIRSEKLDKYYSHNLRDEFFREWHNIEPALVQMEANTGRLDYNFFWFYSDWFQQVTFQSDHGKNLLLRLFWDCDDLKFQVKLLRLIRNSCSDDEILNSAQSAFEKADTEINKLTWAEKVNDLIDHLRTSDTSLIRDIASLTYGFQMADPELGTIRSGIKAIKARYARPAISKQNLAVAAVLRAIGERIVVDSRNTINKK